MSDNNSIYLVDGSSLAFRSFFALITSGLRRSDGTPTWAIIGFYNALFELVEKRNPHCLAISFDLSAPTFRHEEYADYKANRLEMPDDLSVQWPLIKRGIEILGIPNYEVAGYEADDVIGTVAKEAEKRGMKPVIFTGDKDSFQLLDDKIEVLMPTTNEGVKTFDRQEVFNKLGVWPEQVIDYKGLVGDNSDNIPGVRGIGPKTAVQLLTEYKTMEAIFENLDNIKSQSVRNKLSEGRDSAFQSKRLATIVLNAPVDFDFEHCRLKVPDIDAVVSYFREVEANAILKRLPRILKYFNNGVEPQIDSQLLEPIGKTTRRPPMKKAATVGAEMTSSGEGGGVAVAEQKRLDLAIPSRVGKIGTPGLPEPDLVRTTAQLDELVAELSKQKLIALEVLRDSHDGCEGCIVGYAFSWTDRATWSPQHRPVVPLKELSMRTAYIPVLHRGDDQQLPAELVQSKLKPILENENIGKVSFNAKLEMNALGLSGVGYKRLAFDPMLASYVVNPDEIHRLREQGQRLLGYSIPNVSDLIGSGKKEITWDLLPVMPAAQYAADAARISLMLCGVYCERLDADQQELLFDMDMPLSSVLSEMERFGVKIDVDYFQALSVEIGSELARLEREIYGLAGHEFNIGSPVQLQTVLFKELKLPTKGKTKTGYSTDASVLDELAEDHAIAARILEWRHLSKLKGTYVDALPRQISSRDGRLHGDFNQTSTATGRLSSTNPNLQNIPIRTDIGQRIRRGFVSSDDQHVLICADYSQIEPRLLAHMSADENLLAAFRNDEDLHSVTAGHIFNVASDKVTREQRGIGKTLNLALVYGQGAFATGKQMGVSTREAAEFIEKYYQAFSKLRPFREQILQEARVNGFVQTLWGRRIYFHNLNDANDAVRKAEERAAFNAPLQGSAADLIKRAMIRLSQVLAETGMETKLILQVHDELILDTPLKELDRAKQMLVDAMTADQGLLTVPLKVNIGVGRNWVDAK
ncbi:MAG TPA: DNA polymerase I [Candidatus Obscuribacterales bacterium]